MRFHTVLFYHVWNVNSSFAQYIHVLYTLTTHGQYVVFSNIRSTVIFPKDSSDGAANSDKPKKSHKVLPGGKTDQKKKRRRKVLCTGDSWVYDAHLMFMDYKQGK